MINNDIIDESILNDNKNKTGYSSFNTIFCFCKLLMVRYRTNMTDYLSQRFLRYTETIPREEIFIHSDRDDYIAGEDVWFNIYLLDRQSIKPLWSDKIAYFELLNPENQPIVQKRILIDKGFGPGQITPA